jgi:hypothetical protein
MDERDSIASCPKCSHKQLGIRMLTVPGVIRVEGGSTHTGRDIYPDVENDPEWG